MMKKAKAKTKYVAICFYPRKLERSPEKFHFRSLARFTKFATTKGFVEFNQYEKKSRNFIKKYWIPANFPRNTARF